jgi:hypothetical protein
MGQGPQEPSRRSESAEANASRTDLLHDDMTSIYPPFCLKCKGQTLTTRSWAAIKTLRFPSSRSGDHSRLQQNKGQHRNRFAGSWYTDRCSPSPQFAGLLGRLLKIAHASKDMSAADAPAALSPNTLSSLPAEIITAIASHLRELPHNREDYPPRRHAFR